MWRDDAATLGVAGSHPRRVQRMWMPDLRLLENFKAIRLGPGTISKGTVALMVTDVAAAVLAFSTTSDSLKLDALLVIAVSYPMYHVVNFLTLKFFPQHALLEGAQLVDYYRAQQSALGIPAGPERPQLVSSPDRPDPFTGAQETTT